MTAESEGNTQKSGKSDREAVLVNVGLILLALFALGAAGWTLVVSQFRGGTDDLFMLMMSLLVALLAAINPALWAYEKGWLKGLSLKALSLKDETGEENSAMANEEHVFEGTSRLFVTVWLALLGLTGIEVLLAYIQLEITLMLIILMGASIMKAALIMAYFMHLRFERLSLILTLVPAMVICITLLAIIFPDSFRLSDLRSP